MAKLIMFSGPSLSGKTSAIQRFEFLYPHKLRVLNENIREYVVTNIDDLREDAEVYLNLQIYVISAKLIKEFLYRFFTKKTVLVDRALIDSYYYFKTYVNKDKLGIFGRLKYAFFDVFLTFYIKYIYPFIYYKIIFCQPLEKAQTDHFRPRYLDSKAEYRAMAELYLNLMTQWTDALDIWQLQLDNEEDSLRLTKLIMEEKE